MKTTFYKLIAALSLGLVSTGQAAAQSAVTRMGTYDAGGTIEYSQYLYIGPGAHITIPAGQEWVIASQYVFIAPTAVIDGGGKMILDHPGSIGALAETVAWSGQPTTIDGGGSKILAQVIQRNPNNLVLGAVSTAPSMGDISTANTDHTLYIGNNFTWATTLGNGSAVSGNDVLLGAYDLRFSSTATETGYRPAAFAVTAGNGHVVKESYTAAWVYPVGIAEGDYTPATVNPTVANTVHVNVANYTTSVPVENFNNTGMQRTWNIYGDVAGSTTNIALQHNSTTNQSAFNSSGNYVTQYQGTGSWQVNAQGASIAGVPSAGTELRNRDYAALATNTAANQSYYIKASEQGMDTDPDFNITYINTPVTGNVSTNDDVPVGSTYGTPVAQPGYTNPSTAMPVMNPNGTYSFVTSVPGEYNFLVPVCYNSVCTNELLNITVLDNNKPNPPVANNDVTETPQNTPVTVPVLGNDKPGTPGTILPPGNVVVIDNNPGAGTTPAGGTTTVNPDGSISYTPPTGFTGTDTITYKICDNGTPSMCDTAQVYVTVDPTGTPNTTTANDDYVTTNPSTSVGGNVLTNDHDAEGNTQTVVAQTTTIPGKGTLTLGSNGAYTFVPVTGFNGPVDFPYAIFDNGSPVASDTATLHILVSKPLDTDPDFNTTYINTPVTGNVSTNDDVPVGSTYGTPVAQPGYTNPSTAMPVMNPNGAYSFVTSVTGEYNFLVPVCYNSVCTNELLNITVLDNNKPNPPVANNDVTETPQNTPVTVPVLGNDKPGTPGTTLPPGNVVVIDNNPGAGTTPAGGTTTVNPDGSISYTPPTGFTGTDTITYKICDNGTPSMCDTAQVYVTVDPTGTPNTTTANEDYVTTNPSTSVGGNVLTNDHDAEGNTQSVVAQTTTIPGKGTLTLGSNGAYTFVPVPGFSGPVDFPYAIFDNGSPVARDTATLHILVSKPLDTDPDFNTTYINTPVTGNVSTNDDVPVGSTYGTPVAQPGYTNPSTAMPVMNPDGTYSFVTSVPGEYNFLVPVCYNSVCTNELLNITVLSNNQPNPPVANNDVTETPQNTPVTVPVLGNDKPGTPGTTLPPGNVVVIDNNPGAGTTPAGGTTTINPDGSITYTPPTGFTGTDTITYKICDNGTPSMCDTAQVYVTVDPTGTPNTTTANDDYVTTNPSTSVGGNVLTNDHDAEGNTQSAVAQTTTIPGKGTLTLGSNGAYTFVPVPGFNGPVDFPYAIFDNGSPVARDTATLHILVNSLNTSKTDPDMNVTYVNLPVTGNVSTNDDVPVGSTYGTPVAQPGYTNPNTAMPVMNPNGTYSFVTSVPGEYNFLVPVCYNSVCTNELLNITVLDTTMGVHNPPVANNDVTETPQNTPVTVPVLGNDQPGTPSTTLPPGNVVVIDNNPGAGTTPAGGTTTVNPDGSISYTPPTGFSGKDTIMYQICDNGTPSMCDTAIVVVTVNPPGTPNTTTAVDDYSVTTKGKTLNGNVLANDHDAEGNTLTVVAQTIAISGKGTLTLNTDGSYAFVPASGFVGAVEYPYAIFDNGSPVARDTATLHILVGTAPDFTPVVQIDALSFPAAGDNRDFVVNIVEVANMISLGQVAFRIPKLSAFTITYGATTTTSNVSGGTTVFNNDWIITETSSYILCTLKPGKVISPYGYSALGFNITRKAGIAANTSQPINAIIIAASGGDSNSANNSSQTSVTATNP
nr:Ig-like domain-containing protein [Edaphocola flava]